MPSMAPKKKELYLGKCLGDLHKLSEIKPLGSSVNIIIRSSNKVFQDAESLDTQGDEERAYVMYMKYFNILKQVKTKADYKKQKDYFDNLIGKKNQLKAIERAEHLSESLKERYDLKEAEAVAKKLSPLDSKPPVVDKKETIEVAEIKTEEEPAVSINQPAGAIKSTKLCELLRDANTKLILMDVRPEVDFHQSHLSHTECISVPEEIIVPGSTVNHIQAKLPGESKTVWMQRQHADHIILLDWKSTIENVTVGTPLKTLKDALFKYDVNTIIKSEPLILEGGYEQWLLFYPTMTTNAHVARPSDSSQARPPSPTMTLDFDYPDLDDNLQTASANAMVSQTVSSGSDTYAAAASSAAAYTSASVPRVDRSLKPSVSVDGSTSSNTSEENVRSSGLNNAQSSGTLQGLGAVHSTASASSLYPNVSASVKPEKNTNILNDRTTNGQKSISLSFKNNLASDLSQSVERREEKEAELKDFQKSRDNTLKEDQHRLEEAEKKLRDLELMKKKEEKDVADLMRMKRKLKEEIESERSRQEEERQRLAAEEDRRSLALEQARREEEEKKHRLEEVERLRLDRKREEQEKDAARKQEEEEERKKKEAEEKAAQQKLEEAEREKERHMEAARAKKEEAERIKKEEEQELQRKLEEEKRQEEAWKEALRRQKEMEQQKKDTEEAKRIQEEREAAARKEEERKQKELMKKEKERKRREELERKKMEEAAREKAQREREAAEKARQMKVTEQPPSKAVPSNMLPAGWEKRLDRATNRYFYIDHNHGTTQWVPPPAPASSRPPDTYVTKLKDEPSVTSSSRGLSRSHSSPNIKKQLEEEEERARRPMPSVDRGSKPSTLKAVPKQTAYVVRKRELNPVFGNVGPGLTGLRNLGNTCYMNSTIQCLSHTSPLISYILSDSYLHDINRESSQGMHGEVVDDFAVVIKALWSQQFRSITPRDLKNTVGKYNPMFAGYQQQDSQEFLTFLLDGLHEGLNEVRSSPDIPEQNNDKLADIDAANIAWKHHKLLHKSIIVELFQGQLKSTLMCRTCRKTSVTFQAFMFLSLPIPASSRCSLKDCIQEFLKPEVMTGSSKWKCPRCKVERDSEKKIDIWKLPPILLVGLNRFYSEGMWMQKKTTYVDFPIADLDFSPYILGPPPRSRYNLYGISNHYGTMEGGHYTAFCRNPVNKKWYKFDDHDVYEMSRSDVKTSAAFVLYYTSIEMAPPQYLPHL